MHSSDELNVIREIVIHKVFSSYFERNLDQILTFHLSLNSPWNS